MNPPIGKRLNSTPTQWTLNPLHASYDTLPKRPCVEVSMKNGDYACTVRMLLHKSSTLCHDVYPPEFTNIQGKKKE